MNTRKVVPLGDIAANVERVGVEPRKTMTADEHAERMLIVEEARASVFLEGFTVSPEIDALDQRFIEGELSMDELIAATRVAVGLSPTGD